MTGLLERLRRHFAAPRPVRVELVSDDGLAWPRRGFAFAIHRSDGAVAYEYPYRLSIDYARAMVRPKRRADS